MKEALENFKQATHTAIISDLHLCEAQPVNLKFPLWKKYKTKQFFFDNVFASFLADIEKRANAQKIELVLNGDIFDFDSVTAMPEHPIFRISWLEHRRGLFPQEEKSVFKINKILEDHDEWVQALRNFMLRGHRVIFVIGNHDLELHFREVQKTILEKLNLPRGIDKNLRFVEWFYISNEDTLIEHGNQYDPYCLAIDPISPFVLKFNRLEVRIPFGNLTTRYLINGMGFFNPHVDANFIMSLKEYVLFFFKYIVKAEPFLMINWLWGSTLVLLQSFFDNLLPPWREPLELEDKIEGIAERSNATPRIVRELRALTVPAATSRPLLIVKELWLDRAFMVMIAFFLIFELILVAKQIYDLSFFWMFIPLFSLMPFFIFYSRSVTSEVHEFKEPKERILSMASHITKVNRIIYGHTHIVRHEIIGPVEHLNSGTWSPAFADVECTMPIDQKTFVWITPETPTHRAASVFQFKEGESIPLFTSRGGVARRPAKA